MIPDSIINSTNDVRDNIIDNNTPSEPHEEKSEPQQNIKNYTFYNKTEVIDIGATTIEFEYMYQVDDKEILSAEVEAYKITTAPLLHSSQILEGNVFITDTVSGRENGALEFIFVIEQTLSIGLSNPGLEWFSIDIYTNVFTVKYKISHDWSDE